MINVPITASKAPIPTVLKLVLKLTTVTFVDSLATTRLAPWSPINATKRPIPTDTPFFNVVGIALNIASRTLVSESTINTSPSTNTAKSATFQLYPMLPHTVYAKYALSPSPGASAKG